MARSFVFACRNATETLAQAGTFRMTLTPTCEGDADDARTAMRMAVAGTFSNFSSHVVANGVSAASVFAMRNEGADQALTFDVLTTATGRHFNDTHTFTTAAGNHVNFGILPGAGGTTIDLRNIVAVFEPTDSGKTVSFLSCNSQSSTNYTSSGTFYLPINGQRASNTVIGRCSWTVPEGITGTIESLWASAGTINNAGNSLVITLNKNGGNEAMTVTLNQSTSQTYAEYSASAISVTAGDVLAWEVVSTFAAGGNNLEKIACQLVTTNGKFVLNCGAERGTNLAAATQRYDAVSSAQAYNTTEENCQVYVPIECVLSLLQVEFEAGSVGASCVPEITVRRGGADVLQKVCTTGSDALQTASGSVLISVGDLVNLDIIGSGTGNFRAKHITTVWQIPSQPTTRRLGTHPMRARILGSNVKAA